MYPLDKGKIKKNYDLFFGLQEVVVIPARLAAVKTVVFCNKFSSFHSYWFKFNFLVEQFVVSPLTYYV